MAYYRYLLESLAGVLELESFAALALEIQFSSPPFVPSTTATEINLGPNIAGVACSGNGGGMGMRFY